jgi:peroxiredoxin
VVGISPDPIQKLTQFQEEEHAPQRFVSDPKADAITAYGVKLVDAGQTYAKRVTFIIGRDGKIAHEVFDWSPLGNVNKTLDWLKAHPQ